MCLSQIMLGFLTSSLHHKSHIWIEVALHTACHSLTQLQTGLHNLRTGWTPESCFNKVRFPWLIILLGQPVTYHGLTGCPCARLICHHLPPRYCHVEFYPWIPYWPVCSLPHPLITFHHSFQASPFHPFHFPALLSRQIVKQFPRQSLLLS